jgi:hypothetical protein
MVAQNGGLLSQNEEKKLPETFDRNLQRLNAIVPLVTYTRKSELLNGA